LTLELKTGRGDEVSAVARKMVEIASLLGIAVEVKFNDKRLRAGNNRTVEQILADYWSPRRDPFGKEGIKP
jgi:hypothetical protein